MVFCVGVGGAGGGYGSEKFIPECSSGVKSGSQELGGLEDSNSLLH